MSRILVCFIDSEKNNLNASLTSSNLQITKETSSDLLSVGYAKQIIQLWIY